MKLCELYKFPTLAVKTFIHMRKYKIDITPITYSYYNRALTDASTWPTFEQDKWARVRLIWLVIGKFKQNLKIKKQREELLKKKKRRKKSNGSRTIKRRSKQDKNNLKRNSIQIQNAARNVAGLIHMNTSEMDTSFGQSHSNLNDEGVNFPALNGNNSSHLPPNSAQTSLVQLNRNDIKNILLTKDQRLHPNIDIGKNSSAGILSVSLINKQPVVEAKTKTQLELIKNLNLSNSSLNSSYSSIKITFVDELRNKEQQKTNNKSNVSPVPITQNDPLGAFSYWNRSISNLKDTPTSAIVNSKNNKILNNFNDIKRRLFDYKPFADSVKNSDFLYEKPAQKKQQTETTSYYDSDLYSETEDSEENEQNSDENSNEGHYLENEDEKNGSDAFDDEEDDELGSESDSVDVDSNYHKKSLNANNDNSNHLNVHKNGSNLSQGSNSTSTGSGDMNGLATQSPADIESNSVNSSGSTVNSKKSSFSSPFSKLLSQTKMLSLVESSTSKLKGAAQFLTDKSYEIKDVIMSNTNQHDITNKLKTFSSNYQINTPTYLNGFMKSKTSLTTFNSNQMSGGTPHLATPSGSGGSGSKKLKNSSNVYNFVTTSAQIDHVLEHNIAFESKFDLEQIPSDETFKQLTLNWWGLDKDGNSVMATSKLDEMLVDVQISSCN